MYSSIRNIQYLVALLKNYSISTVVISPGGNNIPIIHSIDQDSFFRCYSVVDERSAAYVAIGIAQKIQKPVALVCTSGTAVSNYLPGVTEAHYQRIPLVVITSDRSPYLLNQLETQKINQIGIFGDNCKIEVNLPIVRNDDDAWYCQRLINEALSVVDFKSSGPVHINVPTTGNPTEYNCASLPLVRRMGRYRECDIHKVKFSKYLLNKKILVVAGENYRDLGIDELLESFCEKYNAVCIADYMSNITTNSYILSYRITETMRERDFESLIPDIVISFGNNILSNNLKIFLRHSATKFLHWSIDESGEVRDIFKSIPDIFEMPENKFFETMNRLNIKNKDDSYTRAWKAASSSTKIETDQFSSLKVVSMLEEKIPKGSTVDLAILNSTRCFNFFESGRNKNIKVYSNFGALGIDGCMSTFIGHSLVSDALAFLIIGDLSFFYDMNSLGITGVKNNIRILVLNNGGGSEFHFNIGKQNVPTLNDFIAVEHKKSVKGWVESIGFEYIAINSEMDAVNAINKLVIKSDKPIVAELFTDMEKDAEILKKAIEKVAISRSTTSFIRGKVKSMLGM